MLDFAFRIQHWPGGRWLKPKDKLPPLVAPQKGSEEETIANDERNDQKSSRGDKKGLHRPQNVQAQDAIGIQERMICHDG